MVTNNAINVGSAVNGVVSTGTTGVLAVDTTNFQVLSTGVQLKGNNTNTAPPAGFIGEQIIGTATGVSVTNNSPKTITSITLTPGIWDVSGMMDFGGTLTGTACACGIATVTNSTTGWTAAVNSTGIPLTPNAVSNLGLSIVNSRILVSANTTYFWTALALFSVGTLTVGGRLSGVRVG